MEKQRIKIIVALAAAYICLSLFANIGSLRIVAMAQMAHQPSKGGCGMGIGKLVQRIGGGGVLGRHRAIILGV